MSHAHYSIVMRLPLNRANEPEYRDLVRQYATLHTSGVVQRALLALVGEAA